MTTSTCTTTTTTTTTTCWAVWKQTFFNSGRRPGGSYVRAGGLIIAVRDKASASRLADAISPRGTYYLAYGEYDRPTFDPRRIKHDPARVRLVREEDACRILGLDYDLAVEDEDDSLAAAEWTNNGPGYGEE